MPWKRQVLVVAKLTAGSPELLSALQKRAELGPTAITVIVPATPFEGGREAAAKTLSDAVAQLRDAGLEADGVVGHADPFVAVTDAWDPKRYDEIIVSTLPIGVSKWLHAGLPERVERVTGALVTHIVAQPPSPVAEAGPAPAHEDRGVLAPLSVLGWGRPRNGPRAP
jgi:hypothetical protein